MPFDFFIPVKNILIEYDGELHYKSIPMFGGESHLLQQNKNDDIKTKWAAENGFTLIRITYLMKNDEKIRILKNILEIDH